MRDIKFRAWDKKEKQFIGVFDLYEIHESGGDAQTEAYWNMTPNDLADVETVHFQQYTGLKDKNGVEVYEGDILRYKDGVTAIEFNVREASWLASNDNANLRYVVDFGGEVVGNIYENKDLLND